MADSTERAVIALAVQTGDSKQQLDALKKSTDAVVDSTEKLVVTNEKQTASRRASNDAVANAIGRLDPLVRSYQDYQKTIEQINRWQRLNIGTEEEHARLMDLAKTRLDQQNGAINTFRGNLDKYTMGVGLARHELVNFSRQIQDVGVSLASGQSPLMVAIQQGTQIADIFASSRATMSGFFTQAAAGAGRFVTSFAGIAAALAGIGAGALAAASSWGSSQRDIERALLGIGAASGVTVSDINKIAEAAASSTKISTSEAQEAASTFAATGKIYKDNIATATNLTYNFAKAIGVDTTAASKELAAALADPIKGFADLEKRFGAIDGTTRGYIRSLQLQGREQEAQKALIDAFIAKIDEAAKLTSIWAKAWDAVSTGASKAYSAVGKALSAGDPEAQLKAAEARLAILQERAADPTQATISLRGKGGGDTAALEAAKRTVDALRASVAATNATAEKQQLQQWAKEGDDAVRALIPQLATVEDLTRKITELQRADPNRMEQGGQRDAALQAAQLLMRVNQQSMAQEANRVAAVNKLVEAYNNAKGSAVELLTVDQNHVNVIKNTLGAAKTLSDETIKQVKGLEDQIKVAQARAGADTLAAQQAATYNRLRLEGKSIEEASLIAAKERALAIAQANKSIDDQIVSLRQSVELERARLDGTEAATAAAQAYENAMRSGADATHAAALAAATLNANMEKAEIAAEAFANKASQASNALDQAGRASGGIGTLGGTHTSGQGVGIILPGGRGLGAQSIGDPKFAAAWPIIMAQEQARTDAIKKIMDAMELSLKERTPGTDEFKAAAEAQQQAARALQQAAEDQKQAAAAAAEAARQAGDLRFQNIAAQYIIQGIAPLAINAMIESGAIQRFDASSTFKTQLDLYRRAGVSSSQTRADILAGIIGEGVAPTELLQALDSLTDAVSSNTDAQIGLSDFYTQQGDRLLGYRGYNVQPAGFPQVNTGITTGTTGTSTGTGAVPYGGVVNAGPAGTGLSTGGTLVRVPGTNQWVQTSSYNTYTGLPTAGFTPQPYSTVSGTSTSLYSRGFYQMAEGGVATTPQLGVFGEAGPEAFVPLRGGAIPVKLVNQQRNIAASAAAGPRTIINITAPLVNFTHEPTRDEVRESAYQAAQLMRRTMMAA